MRAIYNFWYIPVHSGYMDLKKKQNSMYMNLKKIFLCVAQAVGVDRCNFFEYVKKLLNFWNFVNIKNRSDNLGF